jgi:hypothetical protein
VECVVGLETRVDETSPSPKQRKVKDPIQHYIDHFKAVLAFLLCVVVEEPNLDAAYLSALPLSLHCPFDVLTRVLYNDMTLDLTQAPRPPRLSPFFITGIFHDHVIPPKSLVLPLAPEQLSCNDAKLFQVQQFAKSVRTGLLVVLVQLFSHSHHHRHHHRRIHLQDSTRSISHSTRQARHSL